MGKQGYVEQASLAHQASLLATAQKARIIIRNKAGWGLMTLLSLATVLLVSRYLTLNPDVFFSEQRAVYLAHLTSLMLHVIGSMTALALGPFLFLNSLRNKWPVLHRWLGRVYLLGNLVGGIGGLLLSPHAYAGFITRSGFATLALLWLATGLMALIRIRNGDVAAHRRWMVRNFALTLGGVMLRLQAPLLSSVLDFAVAYKIVAWTAWAPNLLVAEWLLRTRRSVVGGPVAPIMRLHKVSEVV
ncbi:MAG: DUF2306 domain-containing protein [Caldilineaceae bacterium]